MKRYKKLLIDAAADQGYHRLARAMKIPATSINDWVLTEKIPHLKSLVTMAEYFSHPLPTLLMEDDDPDIIVIDALKRLTAKQKKQLLNYINAL